MNKYYIDPLKVKASCTKGNLIAYVKCGKIYLQDKYNGETVIIGENKEALIVTAHETHGKSDGKNADLMFIDELEGENE